MQCVSMSESALASHRLESILREVFGFDSFRVGQAEAAREILAGRDAFVRMKTSGGKSLCYLLPALIFPGTSIVISPLISLMEDQVGSNRNIRL